MRMTKEVNVRNSNLCLKNYSLPTVITNKNVTYFRQRRPSRNDVFLFHQEKMAGQVVRLKKLKTGNIFGASRWCVCRPAQWPCSFIELYVSPELDARASGN